jgi:tetratricopeptide (TPR) repeat protein
MAKLFSRKPKTDPALAAYPEAMAALITYGEPADDTDYADWASQLSSHVPDLIRMVLDDDLNDRGEDNPGVWAPFHALKVLGVLGPLAAAEPLLECLDWDDDWFQEELPDVYAAIGPEAIPLVHAYLVDASHGLRGRAAAASALAAIAKRHDATRAAIVALLIAFLDRPEADASADEETITTDVIVDLIDLGDRSAYDAIHCAFAENRVNPSVINLEDVEIEFGMRPPPDNGAPIQPRQQPGVRLELRCKACGRAREHLFPKVYFDLGTFENKKKLEKYDPVIIPQEVVCPKCGAVDQYELAGLGYAAVMASMMADAAEKDKEALPIALRKDQRIQFMHFTTQWGPMHPLEAIERYERELARHPDDVSLHEHFGNVLKLLGRLDQAEDHYGRAAELDPKNIESRIGMAQVAMLRKDIAEAIRWWQQAKALISSAALPPFIHRQELLQEINEVLSDLRKGIIPEYELRMTGPKELGEAPEPVPSPPRRAERSTSPVPKVGRNDPCPCGSGKKYKHCHGRSG